MMVMIFTSTTPALIFLCTKSLNNICNKFLVNLT
jgi:hypothetical protein